MRSLITGFLVFFNFYLLSPRANADEQVCASCPREVTVTGEFGHFAVGRDFKIQDASPERDAAYREEIHGPDFTVTVPHLPAGKYTVVIGAAEIFFSEPGRRVFDISCGDQVIATNLDLFAVTGGEGKVHRVTADVNHADDAINGPLKVTFAARENDAKFSTFDIKDASGAAVVSVKASELADAPSAAARKEPEVSGPELWKDPAQPMEARIADLTKRMSLAEKVQQIRNSTPAIPRLGIPAYDFWSEALHGVADAGYATVFPQAIAMAATWDRPLVHDEADVISTEARAKFNDYTSTHNGNASGRRGLTFWSPNVNIFRDPRWGRGQETYGEDPFLTGQIGIAFIHGLQGDNPKYIKAMACSKHYAVHSGPEPERHRFNTDPPIQDLYDTYLPHFEATVREGHVGGVMGAYNSIFGQPACANALLIKDILRTRWHFDGYVVSDCGAIHDIWTGHKYVATPEEAAADAVKTGTDICCGGDYTALLKAVQKNLISEAEIDKALGYALKTRFRLGLFDPPDLVPYSKITIQENDTTAHRALALQAARESIVLLKNDGLLPLDRDVVKRIAVIGANAESVPMLVGNYHGTPSQPVTLLDGIRSVAGPGIVVTNAIGCPLALKTSSTNKPTTQAWDDAVALARSADVVIYVGGISAEFEGEEMARANSYIGFKGGDRTQIELPSVQTEMLKALYATGKPVVFVNCSGSAMAMPWEAKHLRAIVQAWYPGEEGGHAVGEVLFGDVNPAGRLPITFYRSTADLPPFEDYSMTNRTYRYFTGNPEFAFGYGLSYTKFTYSKGELSNASCQPDGSLKVSFTIKNSGAHDGDEVAQVYYQRPKTAGDNLKMALCGFTRVHIEKGHATQVTLEIPAARFRHWNESRNQYVVDPGKYELLIGSASDDIHLRLRATIEAGDLPANYVQ